MDIDFETGEVSVDGTVLQEDYINALTTVDGGVHFPLTVAEGKTFVCLASDTLRGRTTVS